MRRHHGRHRRGVAVVSLVALVGVMGVLVVQLIVEETLRGMVGDWGVVLSARLGMTADNHFSSSSSSSSNRV